MEEPSYLLTTLRGLVGNLVLITATSVVYWAALTYSRGQTHKLRHIPTVGPASPLVSYIGAFKLLLNAQNVIQSGMERFPNSMFKVADMFRWIVVIHDQKIIDEVRMLPDSVLSFREAIGEALQTKFTLGENIRSNPYHIPIVRAQLTRALPLLVPGVHDEVVNAFNDFIPATEDWTSIKVLDVMMKVVARASNRIFVGSPLCRDPDYVNLNVQFTTDVAKASAILRLTPTKLRPMVNALLSNVPERIESCIKHLAPVLAARRNERENRGDNYPEKPLDLLSWLMDAAKNEEKTDWYLASRMLTINFSAIHTSSMTFTHALFYLAAHPEYMQPLRDEVEEVVKRHGWSKDALDEMHRIDSFIKESQRLNPLSILLMNRVLVKDHVFSDGTMVPKGSTISVATPTTHLNDERYEDPLRFDGFRYAKLKEHSHSEASTGTPEKKFDLVNVSIDSLGFGLGRHACPGRFFAASELKVMLAHIVVTYDIKMANEGVRPTDMWISAACIPNPTAQVLFRKRAVA